MSLITRQGKGSKLTIEEMDNNLLYLESLSGTSSTSIIPLSKTVWVNLDLTENNAPQRIFKSYADAITWILANNVPSSNNQWQIMLPGGLIPALSVYPWIRISGIAGTTIERLNTEATLTGFGVNYSSIVINAQILELNVTTENGYLALSNCKISNTVSNGLPNPVYLIAENCFFFGGDFADYNFYENRGSRYFALSGPITNCWGSFNNCYGMVIGNMEGSAKSDIIGGILELTNPCKGTLRIYGSYINNPVVTELVATSDIKLINSFSAGLKITMVDGSQLETEQISPNISVIGDTSGWVHNGEKYNNANSRLASTDVDSAITELATVKAIPVTYIELVALRDASKLIVGQQYRITDYEFTTTQANTQSAGNVFDIIVTADSVNTLNENARAVQHDGDTYFDNANLAAWQLKYSLDNDDTKFAWADTVTGKGVIWQMIDEWNNDLPYDFKNAQFYRAAADVSYIDAEDYYYTFAYLYDGSFVDFSVRGNFDLTEDNTGGIGKYCHNNKIDCYQQQFVVGDGAAQLLNNIVFYSNNEWFINGVYDNSFGVDCRDNTFYIDRLTNNILGSIIFDNIIGTNFNNNTIGTNFNNNTIGTNFNNNTIGNDFKNNTIGNELFKTIFGDNCQHNTISNKINGTTSDKIITFGDGITMCTIQDFAFGVLASNLDLSAATHIRAAYNTTIYKDKTLGVRLSYYDNDILTYAAVTY